jgi:NO-binding membrane sensor protein with MHYT domain
MATARSERLRWLLLAALSIGTTGIWVMHFIAMLGYTIPGQVIHYSVPLTIASMLIAVLVVGIGLLIVGFAKRTWRNLLLAGAFTGLGVASMHYSGMAAMRMSATMTYNPELFGLSIVIAIVAATAALWAALNLSGIRATLGAALIMGVAVSGMHYTGMAAMHLFRPGSGGMQMAGGGATAITFLLPLLIGISVLAFIMTATLALSPTDQELRADAALQERIETMAAGPVAVTLGARSAPEARWPGPASSRAAHARRQAEARQPPHQ